MRRILMLMVLALLGAVLARTAPGADEKKDETKKDGDTDKTFVHKASAAGLAEVNLSTLASRRARNEDVRKFAQHIITDHTKANQELNRLADRKKLPVAQTMDKKHQEAETKLAKLEGADFDRQYIHQMVEDHRQAVSLFENESKNGKDEDLKAWAGKTLPGLREHLKMAQKLAGKDKTETEKKGETTKKGEVEKKGGEKKGENEKKGGEKKGGTER